MSIWSRISEAIAALRAGESLSTVFEKLKTPPERSVAFTIAVIALGAKMAKADGRVTRDEVQAFREIFFIPPEDEGNAAKVFDLARQDVAGYDIYARRIRRMFGDEKGPLCDLLEGLFYIAMADGKYHPHEDAVLTEIARIFDIEEAQFKNVRARFVPDAERDPYDVLGVSHNLPLAEVRKVWRDQIKASHPDKLLAKGLPEEAIKLAEKRVSDLNRAWREISGSAA
ncbi:TerB family tellurite resistance protein [Pelagovum sp. HNIBRBA483]|uniref:TerB family tellurite resistance protein n=1 Tax=Pelagovum sp. HNIBRBA483 TaxID=3233341 RepID=UPI0034A30521